MDLSNLLGGLAGADGAADPTAATQGIQELLTQQGGVNGLIQKLRAGGLGSQVDSWVSTGANEPVAPEELAGALGPDTVNSLASSTGLSIQSLLPLLAGLLPMIINHLTPSGATPRPGEAANQPDLGGLLGGLLGGGGMGNILGGR